LEQAGQLLNGKLPRYRHGTLREQAPVTQCFTCPVSEDGVLAANGSCTTARVVLHSFDSSFVEWSDKVLPLSIYSLRILTYRAFTDVDRRAGLFRRVTAVTVSHAVSVRPYGSFVLAG
jgi:hypothetical protein